MDRIDAPFVLDAALLLGLLLGSIGGLWRGVRREVYVSIGLLLGYALSVSWANPWAADLRDLWSISSATSHFLVATAFVVVPMVVVGTLGARASESAAPDFAGRVGGALLAIANLVVAATLVGRWARTDLIGRSRERDVDATRLVDRLTDELGLVLLGAALTGLALIVGALSVQRRRQAHFRRASPLRPPDPRVHRREHPALAPEAEKVEPRVAAGFGGWSNRPTPRPTDAAATMPIPVLPDPSRNGGSRTPANASTTATSEWLSVRSPERGLEPVDRCLTCGERLTESDRFCPRCGTSLV